MSEELWLAIRANSPLGEIATDIGELPAPITPLTTGEKGRVRSMGYIPFPPKSATMANHFLGLGKKSIMDFYTAR